jgi:hypothetical protein
LTTRTRSRGRVVKDAKRSAGEGPHTPQTPYPSHKPPRDRDHDTTPNPTPPATGTTTATRSSPRTTRPRPLRGSGRQPAWISHRIIADARRLLHLIRASTDGFIPPPSTRQTRDDLDIRILTQQLLTRWAKATRSIDSSPEGCDHRELDAEIARLHQVAQSAERPPKRVQVVLRRAQMDRDRQRPIPPRDARPRRAALRATPCAHRSLRACIRGGLCGRWVSGPQSLGRHTR